MQGRDTNSSGSAGLVTGAFQQEDSYSAKEHSRAYIHSIASCTATAADSQDRYAAYATELRQQALKKRKQHWYSR